MVFQFIPQLKSINEQIASLSVEAARKKLEDNIPSYNLLKKEIEDLRKEKRELHSRLNLIKIFFVRGYAKIHKQNSPWLLSLQQPRVISAHS